MTRSILEHLQRRRAQRWLRREAHLLAQEADAFNCPEMRREARRLIDATGSMGSLLVLHTA